MIISATGRTFKKMSLSASRVRIQSRTSGLATGAVYLLPVTRDVNMNSVVLSVQCRKRGATRVNKPNLTVVSIHIHIHAIHRDYGIGKH